MGSGAYNIALATWTPNKMVPGETFTITLVNVPPSGAIELNGVPVGANYSFTNSSPSSYNVYGVGFNAGFNAINYSLFTDSTGTQLELSFTVVPEPAQVLLIAVVGLMLGVAAVRLRNKTAVAVAGARSF